ncbi:MAG: aminodeoxychorismate synthase component I [Verrucomicrobiota bacterium]
MTPFVSLNSWTHPGSVYQALDPVAVLRGTWDDWGIISETLRSYQKPSADTPHPSGGLVGYISYEGDFCFGVFPEIHTSFHEQQTERWKERAKAHEASTYLGALLSSCGEEEFCRRVEKSQDYIRSGDIYQVNLSHRFKAKWEGNPYTLFESLMQRSPAPGSAFLDFGDQKILSSSPELFLKIQGRHIVTRPIKGTRPRDRDPIRDGQLAYELISDPKELAELIMITDLERNDIGQVCEYGSVLVSDLVKMEKYPQVYHLVSTVEGDLRPEVDAVQAVRACFPGGSITGAPKKRAMEIIQELEGLDRGIYTGAIGYFGFNGDVALSMAIRTMFVEEGEVHFHVGSGITIDSVPKREYQETLHKASGMKWALEMHQEQSRKAKHESWHV